jgi:multidrug efflux pump subunit AcrA (membrane-fusion protein)
MKEKISLFKKRSFEIVSNLTKKQKISLLLGTLGVVLMITTLVYADVGHDSAEPVAQTQTEQVVVRKVGDIDPDSISQEGLSSFYGEIISKDVVSINASREGVISSWNVSVGETVSAGQILGYVTITGVSAEQQQQLALAESEMLKAKLDADLAGRIAKDSGDVFVETQGKYGNLSELQNQAYGNVKNGNTVLGEVASIARASFSEIYPLIGIPSLAYGSGSQNFQTGSSLFSDKTLLGVKYGVGIKKSSLSSEYQEFIGAYVKKIREDNVGVADVQQFLKKTTEALTESFETESLSQTDIDHALELVKDYQTRIAETSVRYREQALVGVDMQKELISFDVDLSMKRLEQRNAQGKAENEAAAARLLAQKLSMSAGGLIPILAVRSGIVASVEKNVGEYVTVSDRVGMISNNNPRKSVRFTVPASWKDINKGDTLSLTWRPEFAAGSATITGISPMIDEMGGYQAEASISEETVFPVGASIRIIPENSKKGVFVNRKAIVFEGATPFVWIVTESGPIRKQEVKVGRGLGEYVEILSGLQRDFSYLVILDPHVVLENGKNISDIIKEKVESNTPAKIQDESQPHSHDE